MITEIQSQENFNKKQKGDKAALFYFSHETCNVCKVLKPKIWHMLQEKSLY